jgi:signal transduction histidine kinase
VRDEFLSIAAHELRTPLTALALLMQRMQVASDYIASNQDSKRVQTRALRQVQRLTALVDSLLDVSRLASGKLSLDLERLDLVEITRDVVNRLCEEALQAKCTIEFDDKGAVFGQWDRLRVEQVLTNLLGNALKYGAGKPIEVQVEGVDKNAIFRIRDHGIGIEPDRLPHIFERFERGVTSRAYGGLGLGLYITRQIVDAHGGDIAVESVPGAGSTFQVMLPAENKAILPIERARMSPGAFA